MKKTTKNPKNTSEVCSVPIGEKTFSEFMSIYQKENVTKQLKSIEESVVSLLSDNIC